MIDTLNIALTALFSQNLLLVLIFAVGMEPHVFLRPKHGFYMGIGLTAVMVVLTPLSCLVEKLLIRLQIEHLLLLSFTLLATGGTFLLGFLLKRTVPRLWRWVRPGVESLPFNGGILGVMLLSWQQNYTVGQSVVFALFGGIGLTVALMSLVGICQNLSSAGCPKSVRGLPLLLITAGFLSLSLVGYYGLHLPS